jgi:hypothetical protein
MLLSFAASRLVLTFESEGVPELMDSMNVWIVRKVCMIDLQRIGYSFVGGKKKVPHYGRSGNGERKVVSPILGISILPLDGNLNLWNINCQDILPNSLYVLSMSTLANG